MYKELDGAEFLKEVGIDGQKWAKAFIEITGTDIDEGMLIGWFANAIMAGHDYASRNKIHIEDDRFSPSIV